MNREDLSSQRRGKNIVSSSRAQFAEQIGEEDDTPDWLHDSNREMEVERTKPFQEQIITKDFDNVRVFITSSTQGKSKWTDTGLTGTLNLVRITYDDIVSSETVDVPPIVYLRLSDRIGDTTFEYEVPLNFKF